MEEASQLHHRLNSKLDKMTGYRREKKKQKQVIQNDHDDSWKENYDWNVNAILTDTNGSIFSFLMCNINRYPKAETNIVPII